MNKELIERLALDLEGECLGKHRTDETVIDFATRFLSAVDAERGKEAFGYISRHAYSWSKEDGWVSIGAEIRKERQQDDDVALFLAPQIPEGMVQRNPEPYLFCGDIAVSNDPRYAGWVFVRHVNGKDWTTGAKLTPETWQMIAAAGVAP